MTAGKIIDVIRSVTVINPRTGDIRRESDIHMDAGRITGIEPAGEKTPAGGLDGSGLYAIPGLIDTHVHCLGFLDDRIPGVFDLGWIFRQQIKNLDGFIRSGVTTVRDMGAALTIIRKYRRKAALGEIRSPRILFSGPMFTVPGGYPYYAAETPLLLGLLAGPLRVDLKNENDEARARQMVDRAAGAGVDCIKIMYQSAKYDEPRTPIPVIPLRLIRVVTDQAHHRGLKVGIHHAYGKDLRKLLEADIPFDSLEHLTTDEELGDNDIARIVRQGLPVSSTLMTYGIIHHVDELETLINEEPERFEDKPRRFFKRMCAATRSGGQPLEQMCRRYLDNALRFMSVNLKKLADAGAAIAFGTDTGVMSPTGVPHWELMDMVRAGMTPLDALRAATAVAADVIGRPELGRLEAGKIADIVLLRANPLDAIANVSAVEAVIQDGRLIHGSHP